MRPRSFPYTLFLSLNLTFALVPSTTNPVGSNNSFPNDSPENSRPNPAVPLSLPVQCDGDYYGRRLSKRSCKNALEKMSRSDYPHRLYPRPRGYDPSIPVMWRAPIRYLSDDGLCAIDVRLDPRSPGDTIRDREVASTAESILSNCVESSGEGGSGRAQSQDQQVTVAMLAYEPHVNCDQSTARPPTFQSCEQTLQTFPIGVHYVRFAITDRADAGCLLPRHFFPFSWGPEEARRCNATVSMSTVTPTRESWFNIYAAGVAVNVMCVQRGLSGKATQLGRSGDIALSLRAMFA